MPRVIGYRDRTHLPLWDTLIHPPLPCDFWITRVDPEPMIVVFLPDQRPWNVPHEWPLIRAIEIKHADDVVGWPIVVADGWRQLLDLHA
jgi:hypothetical protein